MPPILPAHAQREADANIGALHLFITTKTVETHLHHVFDKLGPKSRTELEPVLDPTPAQAHAPVA
jgi:hypothetical protein